MDIIIREMREQDYTATANLLVNELWDNKFNGDNIIPFFEKVKDDENYKAFVAISDGVVVGFVFTVTQYWAVSEAADMFIQAIAVKADFRNKGIGTSLLKYVEDYAKAKGYIGVGLQSGTQRSAVHAFYERNGYNRSYHFSKMLNPIQ